VDLVLSSVFAGVERKFWGILLRRWINVHVGGLPNMMELLVHSKCLGHAVEVFVTIFGAGKATADRQWSSISGHPQLEVSVVWNHHESGERWSFENSVILRGPIDDLELNLLLPEV
jgi:hypothetical protein